MNKKLYKKIASNLTWRDSLIKSPPQSYQNWWSKVQEDEFHELEDMLPSGSGIDSGCKIDPGSKPDRIIITFSYHFMNETGYYGWEDYRLYITPSLAYDFNMRITGPNRQQIKDYFYDMFDHVLRAEVE